MYSPGFFPKGYLCKPFNGGYDMVQALAGRYAFEHTVEGLVNGTTYRFAVRAEDALGQEDSNVQTLAATPTALRTPTPASSSSSSSAACWPVGEGVVFVRGMKGDSVEIGRASCRERV